MKKLLLVLGMITCIVGMTACGKEVELMDIVEADAIAYGEELVANINGTVLEGMIDQYEDDVVISKALMSFEMAIEDMGNYESIKGTEVLIGEDSTTIAITIVGSKKEAVMEIMIDDDYVLVAATTSVSYTMSEKMGKAGLDTIIGMGSVFFVLILISFIISGFSLISKMEQRKAKKSLEDKIVVSPTPQSMITEEIEEVELADDLELVAVISAAIAASEGNTSTDGFVVRSIKRANKNKWQKA